MASAYVLPGNTPCFARSRAGKKNARATRLIIFLSVTLFANVHAHTIRFSFVSPLEYLLTHILNICAVTRADIAKECAKLVLYSFYKKRDLVKCGAYKINSDHAIDYGCEAVWAGYQNEMSSIPEALIKYGCVDLCYHQVCAGAKACGLTYGSVSPQNFVFTLFMRTLVPCIVKKCICTIITHYIMPSSNHEDELLYTEQYV